MGCKCGGERTGVSRQTEIQPDWRERLATAGLQDLTALLTNEPPERFRGQWEALRKPGLGGRERWRWRLSASGPTLYLKRYFSSKWREQWDRIYRQKSRRSRGWWEYHQSNQLARRYIPAVRAVGVAEEMRGFFERRSAVLFEEVAGDAFDRVWSRLEARRAPLTYGRTRHEMNRCLARFVSAFHQTGLCHRDLYLCHIFIDLADDEIAPRFTLIDLARVHRPCWRRTRWIIKDLSQLDCSAQQIGATRTDRLRFLLAYLGLEPNAPRVRFYVRRVARKSARILRQIERRSRRQ